MVSDIFLIAGIAFAGLAVINMLMLENHDTAEERMGASFVVAGCFILSSGCLAISAIAWIFQ